MISKRILASCLAASVALTQAAPVMADGGDVLLGGVIGAIVGGAIVNENNKKRYAAQRRTTARPSVTSAQREENRQIQTALNYFGYPVGAPDGSLGARSRAAISEYQATLGYTPTGQLTEYEQTLLLTSYQRGIAGGPVTAQQAAANPLGMRGLIVAWRDEAAAAVPQAQAAVAPAAVAPAAVAPVPAAVATAPDAAPDAAPAAPAPAALPSFLANGDAGPSLESECNKVGLVTSTNGGFVTAATMTDPMQALGQQFCLARGYAIAQGEEMAAKVPGFTPQQIADQCAGFGPAMQEQIAALSLKPQADVITAVQTFAASTGMAPAQLSATAKICLSVGYRTDNMPVAVASALLLTGLGEGAYAELLGHHLSQGFGATPRPDLALAWYETGLDAATQPATAVFAPGQPERLEVLRKAAYAVGGKADQAALPDPVPAALPTFQVPADPAPAASAAAATAPVAPAPAAAVAPAVVPAAASGAAASGTSAVTAALTLPFALFAPLVGVKP